MGRIAEALKRAQQERARRAGESPAADDAAPRSGLTEPQVPGPSGPDLAGAADAFASSLFVAPPSPQPFCVTAPAITPERIDPRVVVLHEPASPIAERYRSARTRLLTGNPDGGPRVFAVTSSLPKEGKTLTTANLGFGLAELRHLRVAVIDCDFRQRGLSRLFGAEDQPGLAEIIRGEKALADVCLPVVRDNLYLVPSGDIQGMMPGELLAGAQAAVTFKEINDRFHYSLIDAPPANTVADIGLIAPLCHSVVIVIRLARTPEPLLRRCVRMLQANHVPIAGSILVGYCERTMAYTDTHDYYEAQTF